MANSRERRKSRRTRGLPMPEPLPTPSSSKAMPKSSKGIKRLSRADSWTVLALLVGVFLAIVVPPLWLKAILLVSVCTGVFLFARRSHWTDGGSNSRQHAAASAVIAMLLAIGIPQFSSQWKAEHHQRAITQPMTPAPASSTQL